MDLRTVSFVAACTRIGIGPPTVTQVVFPYLRRLHAPLKFEPPLQAFSDREYEAFVAAVRNVPADLQARITRFQERVRNVVD